MPIDQGTDRLISLGEAAECLGCLPKTAWVYATKGVARAGGLKLESILCGSRHKTTLAACKEFSRLLAEHRAGRAKRAPSTGSAR